MTRPSITWTQTSDTEWVGHRTDTPYGFGRTIELDTFLGETGYFVEGASYVYKTLTAAKIAAAKTWNRWAV